MDGSLRAYGVDHGSGVCYDQAPKDPAKAHRCTVTLATHEGHECRVNRVTGDVFDRVGDERHYVGKSYGSDERDIGLWRRYLAGIHALSPHGRHWHAR